ncbi:MAG: hypothetical protein LBR58_01550 [Propionibacteriaceae bacterium]|jgi:hypothetical protein|nr:hypothetical protein [Propionibacteriaceae bacterium]
MKTSALRVGFPIGAVFFGSLVGPSMISGIYSKVYLVPYGTWAFVFMFSFPLISGAIIGFSAELARREHVYDYNSFSKALYGKASIVCTPLMEIYMLMAQILTLGAVMSMGGTFMQQIAGWEPIFGSLFLGLLCLTLVLKGAGLIRGASSVMCVILAVGFGLLAGYAAWDHRDALANIVSTGYMLPEADLGNGIYMAILFGFSGACNGMVLCALMQKVQTKVHAVSVGFWCFLLTLLVLTLEVLVILPYIPEVMASDVPTMYIIQTFLVEKLPWLPGLYFFVMFFALVTSGVPAYQAMIARVAKLLPKQGVLSRPLVQRIGIGLVFLGVVLAIAQLGLTTIVSRGYSALGFVGILLIALPTCVLMPIKWVRQARSAAQAPNQEEVNS